MADTSDKGSLSEGAGVVEPVPNDKPVLDSPRDSEQPLGQWSTTKWELWTFYTYYIVSTPGFCSCAR